jgi:hypothetical protein
MDATAESRAEYLHFRHEPSAPVPPLNLYILWSALLLHAAVDHKDGV